MEGQGRRNEDCVVNRGRVVAGAAVTGVVEDGDGAVDGNREDSLGSDG
jgi:hypothetical protein